MSVLLLEEKRTNLTGQRSSSVMMMNANQSLVLKGPSFFPQNILELKVCDEDRLTDDDHLLTVLFDVSKIQLGETVCLNFQLNPKVRKTEMKNRL